MAEERGQHCERRQERREYKSWLDVAILSEDHVCVQTIRSPSADVSTGGCGIMTAQEYAIGTEVLMRFGAADGSTTPIVRWGVVRHSRQLSKNGWWMIGFQFLERDVRPTSGFGWNEHERVTDAA